MRFIERFRNEEQGQDLIEYALLLGFVTLFSTGIYGPLMGNISSIWSSAGSTVQSAVPS